MLRIRQIYRGGHEKVGGGLYRLLSELKAAVFPPKCGGCGVFLPRAFPARELDGPIHMAGSQDLEKLLGKIMAPFLCRDCIEGFVPIKSPICPRCGIMFKSREGEDHLCSRCIVEPRRFSRARAPGVYSRGLMEAIHALKYKERVELGRPLGEFLFFFYLRAFSESPHELILPVPLHARRMRKRGFNQAWMLVQEWPMLAEKLGLDPKKFRPERNLLVRTRFTIPQVGLGRKQRRENIRNAFAVKEPERVAKKRVLLADDVLTTGSTATECARVLLKAGAARVDVITLARA